MSAKLIVHHLFLILAPGIFLVSCSYQSPDITPNNVVPSPQQIAYQEMELIGFVHFTVNTFTDKEWGFGDESPAIFNPGSLDTRQWARVAKAAGLKELILTAKHHDGFCLWPSKYTEHSVKNSPWKNGHGDVVRDFVDACREYGLKVGLYLSPWDRNHADYGKPEYLTYYRNQLRELLTEYGEISEIWFDGANGGDGYYGGVNEERRIDRETYYNWPEVWQFVKKLQPNVLIFSDAGPDIRWIGNEHGFAGETNWSLIDASKVTVGAADTKYLNSGDPKGTSWIAGECDVSIRPGWFYHSDQDDKVKSPQELVDIYYKSVGRNGTFLLNIPPDKRGLFHENDVASLNEFQRIVHETFKKNLAIGKPVHANSLQTDQEKFAADNITDESLSSYWAAGEGIINASLEINLGSPAIFDRLMLQEPIRFGQRIREFSVECWIDGTWQEITRGTTVGYKRLLRIDPIETTKAKLNILDANNTPAISNFGLFKATKNEIN
ncbi:alpha-L-fucosidase [candidate division KSB1 bacterium]|nr:alpha-L-fucosidase [candidate division KSB1 bacterium]